MQATVDWSVLYNCTKARRDVFGKRYLPTKGFCMHLLYSESSASVDKPRSYSWADENSQILSSNSVILVEISTRIAGFEERICKFSSAQLYAGQLGSGEGKKGAPFCLEIVQVHQSKHFLLFLRLFANPSRPCFHECVQMWPKVYFSSYVTYHAWA